jgi:hypothetical protein
MTSIDAVTIDARFSVYFSPGVPDLGSKAYFIANPGNIRVGTWKGKAGILTLYLPDGDSRRVPCSDVDEAVGEATLTWNTPAGIAAHERRIADRYCTARDDAAGTC